MEDRSSDSIGDATRKVSSVMFLTLPESVFSSPVPLHLTRVSAMSNHAAGILALRKRERFPLRSTVPCRFDSVTETAPHDR